MRHPKGFALWSRECTRARPPFLAKGGLSECGGPGTRGCAYNMDRAGSVFRLSDHSRPRVFPPLWAVTNVRALSPITAAGPCRTCTGFPENARMCIFNPAEGPLYGAEGACQAGWQASYFVSIQSYTHGAKENASYGEQSETSLASKSRG